MKRNLSNQEAGGTDGTGGKRSGANRHILSGWQERRESRRVPAAIPSTERVEVSRESEDIGRDELLTGPAAWRAAGPAQGDLDLSIILPTYNEAKNIIPLIKEIQQHLQNKPLSYEIIVSDDDSPDKTWKIVKNHVILGNPAKRDDSRIKPVILSKAKDLAKRKIHVLRRLSDHSLARSILDGILNAQGQSILVMDSDFNHDPKMIWQMYKLLEFYDIVVGSRFVPGGGMEDHLRNKFSFLYNLFIRILLGTHIQDNLSGFFAVKKELLMPFATKEIFTGYGEYFIRLLFRARKKGYTIIEVPVFYKLRPHGKSKSNFLKMVREYTQTAVTELISEVARTGSLLSIFNR